MTEILSLVATFLPLFVIIGVANLAEARREKDEPYQGLALVAYVFLVAIYAAAILCGLLLHVISFAAATDPSILTGQLAIFGEADSLALTAFGLWIPSLVGILLLLPVVRRIVARIIHIDPADPIHAVALSMTVLAVVNMASTLGIGLGTVADRLEEAGGLGGNPLLTLWTQQILFALLGTIGVGWLTRRNWRTTLERLGLTALTGRQLLIGIGVGLGIVVIVILIQIAAGMLGVASDADVDRLTEMMFGPIFMTPFGILTIGLSAALGEEILLRGAMLPRFGVILTTLFFVILHVQYGVSIALLVIVVPSLILAWLRLRYNTSTAMITHAVYNMTLGVLAYLGTNLDF